MALDTSSTDRSYLFGRLLAVAEQVERATYDREEKRESNAIRMQAVFAQRPLYAWRIIEEKLIPYYARLAPACALTSKTSWETFWISCPTRAIPLWHNAWRMYICLAITSSARR